MEKSLDTQSSTPSGFSPFSDEPGVVRDPENEGDAELLRRGASGTSNITEDLDLLQPSKFNAESDTEPLKKLPAINVDPCPAINKIADPSTPPYGSGTPPRDDAALNDDTEMNADKDPEPATSSPSRYRTIADLPQESADSSGSVEPASTDYSGKAGLDPDWSSEWVPYSINPELNESKSKKRRRRQKIKGENRRKQDSLGKLLSGRQSKEEEELISTYDHGNSRYKTNQQLNTSGITGGNIHGKK